MHSRFAWLLPLVFLVPAPLAAAPQTPDATDAVRALTFNIRFDNPRDGANRWSARRHLVVDRIQAYRPDVLGLQEALSHQVAELEAALPDYVALGVHRRGGTKDESCKLFLRRSRLAVEENGTFWLSPTPDEVGSRGWGNSLPRICTWAIVRDRLRHTRFLVMNTHFDHRSAASRLESARLLSAWSKVFRLPVLLLGDFNARERSRPIRWLSEHGLRDTFRVQHPDATDVGTSNGFRRRGTAKIDYVFVSSEFTVHGAEIDKTIVDGRFPSDHSAVFAAVGLPAGAPPTLRPAIDGAAWPLSHAPELGTLARDGQRVLGNTIFQTPDGRWHLWAEVRGTVVGPLLHRWVGNAPTQRHWTPRGVTLRPSTPHGESGIAAPFVIPHADVDYLFFSDSRTPGAIQLATSANGRAFRRHRDVLRRSRVFTGPGAARDPMVLRIRDRFHCFYAVTKGTAADVGIQCRTSTDLVRWSAPRRVWAGDGVAAPFVTYREGAYYLFCTESTSPPRTSVHRSTDPWQFGSKAAPRRVATLPVAHAEIVRSHGEDFLSSAGNPANSVQLMRLRWDPEPSQGR